MHHQMENKFFFLNPPPNSSLKSDRLRIRRYLTLLLPRVIKKKKIDCFISAGLFYNQDFDWGASAESVGCPFIVFHRENLIGSKDRYQNIVEKAKFLKEIILGESIVNEISVDFAFDLRRLILKLCLKGLIIIKYTNSTIELQDIFNIRKLFIFKF